MLTCYAKFCSIFLLEHEDKEEEDNVSSLVSLWSVYIVKVYNECHWRRGTIESCTIFSKTILYVCTSKTRLEMWPTSIYYSEISLKLQLVKKTSGNHLYQMLKKHNRKKGEGGRKTARSLIQTIAMIVLTFYHRVCVCVCVN